MRYLVPNMNGFYIPIKLSGRQEFRFAFSCESIELPICFVVKKTILHLRTPISPLKSFQAQWETDDWEGGSWAEHLRLSIIDTLNVGVYFINLVVSVLCSVLLISGKHFILYLLWIGPHQQLLSFVVHIKTSKNSIIRASFSFHNFYLRAYTLLFSTSPNRFTFFSLSMPLIWIVECILSFVPQMK